MFDRLPAAIAGDGKVGIRDPDTPAQKQAGNKQAHNGLELHRQAVGRRHELSPLPQ